MVDDLRDPRNPADDAVKGYTADTGQIITDCQRILLWRFRMFDLLGDIGFIIEIQSFIPDAQHHVDSEYFLFISTDAGKILHTDRITDGRL